MVLVPAGEFQMGSDRGDAEEDEKPVHTVYLDVFYMDKYLVTNAQYKAFVDENPAWRKNRIRRQYHDGWYLHHWDAGGHYPPRKGDYPVVYVSWYAAMAYAAWVGKRLPTEAEWEKAARGGLKGKKYPWGDQINTAMANYGGYIGRTTPVGRYTPNDLGLYDMCGNVWEWCLDEYTMDLDQKLLGGRSSTEGTNLEDILNNFLSLKTVRVLRGGSWSSSVRAVQVGYCGGALPTLTYNSYGFRCTLTVTADRKD